MLLRLTCFTSAGGKIVHKNFTQRQVNKMITLYSACFNDSTLLDGSAYLICMVEPEPDTSGIVDITIESHARGGCNDA